MNKIRKKIKKIRLHQEGTHILVSAAIILLIINIALYWGLECKWPFYIVALASLFLYSCLQNTNPWQTITSPQYSWGGDEGERKRSCVAPQTHRDCFCKGGRAVLVNALNIHKYQFKRFELHFVQNI